MARYRQYDIAEIEALFQRVQRLEERLAALDGKSASPDVQSDPQIAELLRQGRNIEAIKLYREQTGVGLAEAKAAVERLAGS